MDSSTKLLAVSVAMATYNGQQFIQRQLDSLSAQTHLPAELIVTDDGSDDDTLAIINAFAKSASFPVNVYRNDTRLGYRANFMQAAALCRSELIAFCDQDDVWYANKIAASLKPFSDSDVLLTYHNANIVNDDGRLIGSLATRAAQQLVLPPLSAGPWPLALGFTEVFRRSLLPLSYLWPNSRDFYENDERSPHDQWFFLLAAALGKIAYLDEALVAYVQHGSNAYGWRKLNPIERMKEICRNRSDEYSRYAKAAESLAGVFETAKRDLKGIWGERAATAADYYRTFSWLCAERSALYTSIKFRDRLEAFRSVLGKTGYTPAWGLGRKALIVDMCLGVPMGPLLRSNTK